MVMKAKRYNGQSPAGWLLSEKLDGVRAIWDGENFLSRNGNIFFVPDERKRGMPDTSTDGEFWIGRGKFNKTLSIVRRKKATVKDWRPIKYIVFDAPKHGGKYKARFKFLLTLTLPGWAGVLDHFKCKSRRHFQSTLKKIFSIKGEGLIMNNPEARYTNSRTPNLLKVTKRESAEAKIVGYKGGKGKYEGLTGALICVDKYGKKFGVGSGLSDALRHCPPKIGEVVTYSFKELTEYGAPREPAFVGVRDYE